MALPRAYARGVLPVDATVVRRRLRRLERCIRALRELREQGRDAFVSDQAVQDRAERNTQLAAQACADIALHIVAAIGMSTPEAYADAVAQLGREGMVPTEVATRVSAAARLRNILVHDYLDVDPGRLFDELDWIEDATAFGETIERWLEAREA